MRKVFRIYELEYIDENDNIKWYKNDKFILYDDFDYATEEEAINSLTAHNYPGSYVILPVYIID